MKAIALVWTFAALAAAAVAQQPKNKPSEELANAIAVEEQERDLAKAEKLYREALAGKGLSDGARALATERLAGLLVRLGKKEEAAKLLADATPKGAVVTLDDVTNGLVQDVEREKALRAKARELVKQMLAPPAAPQVATTVGPVNQQKALVEQLRWIGEPAVPEVAAALAAETWTATDAMHDYAVAQLAGFLWTAGSEVAAAHIKDLVSAGKPMLKHVLFGEASQHRDPRMTRLVLQFARDEADDALVLQLLGVSTNNRDVVVRADPDAVIDLLAQKGPKVRTAVLPMLGWEQVQFGPEALAKVHALVRQALQGSDPELARAAQQILVTAKSQASPAGFELLLDELPRIRVQHQVGAMPLPPAWRRDPAEERSIDPAVAARLWPRLVACARTLDRDSVQFGWLEHHMQNCAWSLDTNIVPDVLELAKQRFERTGGRGAVGLLYGKVTSANAAQVFALHDQLKDRNARLALLDVLANAQELPPDLYEPLVRAGETPPDRQQEGVRNDPGQTRRLFLRLLVNTGRPEAANAVLDYWRGNKMERDEHWLLVQLGKRTQDEALRAAMREVVADPATEVHSRSHLLLALLSMHDVPALDLLVAAAGRLTDVPHPYAKGDAKSAKTTTPLRYLLDHLPQPPHGFTEDDVIAVLGKLWKGDVDLDQWSRYALPSGPMSDRVLGELARLCLTKNPSAQDHVYIQDWWVGAVLQRVRSEGGRTGALKDWVAQRLNEGPDTARVRVLRALEADEVTAERARIEALVGGEDEDVAIQAVHALHRAEVPIEPARLAANRHARVRERLTEVPGQDALVIALLRDPDNRVRIAAADCLGARVNKDAVPGLIELLRDGDEGVRREAADALARIRFHHEQQGYWDRIVKGLDVSPASAAEKLLLQGKPGAAKEQRLLAIASLGTLGVPEALPFLIEWTQDADAEVAKAAKDAITAIHLKPRR